MGYIPKLSMPLSSWRHFAKWEFLARNRMQRTQYRTGCSTSHRAGLSHSMVSQLQALRDIASLWYSLVAEVHSTTVLAVIYFSDTQVFDAIKVRYLKNHFFQPSLFVNCLTIFYSQGILKVATLRRWYNESFEHFKEIRTC